MNVLKFETMFFRSLLRRWMKKFEMFYDHVEGSSRALTIIALRTIWEFQILQASDDDDDHRMTWSAKEMRWNSNEQLARGGKTETYERKINSKIIQTRKNFSLELLWVVENSCQRVSRFIFAWIDKEEARSRRWLDEMAGCHIIVKCRRECVKSVSKTFPHVRRWV